MTKQEIFNFQTEGRGTYEITSKIAEIVANSKVYIGTCNVFVHHTSASLIISENADPTVRVDLETILQRLAPDADPEYQHDYEGDDDMSGHIRCMLTNDSLTIPVTNGKLSLGAWQGLYLYEHRYRAFNRKITVTVLGGRKRKKKEKTK